MDWKKIAPVVIVIALIGGFSWYAVDANKNEAPKSPAVETTATPTQVRELSYQGEDGKNALTLLKEKYVVQTKSTSFGEMVESINGLAADSSNYWSFSINGTEAMVGADAYEAKSTDTLGWTYKAL